MSPSLDKRLNMAASLVREHRFTVDVGTDHAYLPAFLVLSGKTDKAAASDVAAGPLKNAAYTIERYGLQDKISLYLSDGLKSIPCFENGDIVICGMGGNLIADILDAAAWVCRKEIHLVLQPMSHCEDVRKWLCEHGFEIAEESAVSDQKHTYICISAFYTGHTNLYEQGYYYFGRLPDNPSPCARQYINATTKRIEKRLSALENAKQSPTEIAYLKKVLEYGEKQ